ncbi:Methyltransferase type 11 [Beauveria bassiana ARSEF 2860]|uniref:Methyltransferase type 11 n=1 Tax=Beauveria bassiana (strain ARSEF 2860) TaxID=655819 RepID=J4UET3_BEAB2|nr:Methyltransferase type 11 [Beauveria bassiana ARSEF 2860]EJP60797.1 Methyltransferase type 11 [Beauveria bassiana ARSEF 2860]
MKQFDAEADAIENGVICVLGILLYIATVHQRWRHLKAKPGGEKWYCHISLVLLSIFVIGSILCSLWFGIARSRDSPARVPSVIWKAIMVLCLTVSKLHIFNQALRPQKLIGYYACISILPVVWVGVSVWQKRYAALWVFPGWIYLICAAAFLIQSVRICKQAWSRRRCLMLGLMNALAGTLTAAPGIFSVLIVTPPFYFVEQCFIIFLELTLTVVTLRVSPISPVAEFPDESILIASISSEDAASNLVVIMSELDKSCELSERVIAGMKFERCGTSAWCPMSLDAATYPCDYHCDMLSFDDNRLISAPVKWPVRILDVGTGPGILAGELAKRFPDADVIGLDFFSNSPAEFPETCEYQSGNIDEPWEFETGYFCLIVMRNVGVYLRHHKWCRIYSEILRCLRPGGHFEHSEIDILSDKPMVERCLHYELSRTNFPSLPAWERYEILSAFASLFRGRHFNIAHNTHNRFTEADFANITQEKSGSQPAISTEILGTESPLSIRCCRAPI